MNGVARGIGNRMAGGGAVGPWAIRAGLTGGRRGLLGRLDEAIPPPPSRCSSHGEASFVVNPGDRGAQLVVARVERVGLEICERLGETQRGSDGSRSTG